MSNSEQVLERMMRRKENVVDIMRERPIIFSAESVKTILDGKKTQTRRVAKGVGYIDEYREIGWEPGFTTAKWYTSIAIDRDGMEVPGKEVFGVHSEDGEYGLPCPHGAPGDRLWVKETVACGACAPMPPKLWSDSFWRREQGTARNPTGLWYKADGLSPDHPITERGSWVSPMFMPRWASRLTLEIVNVRCEQLQYIKPDDLRAEGYDSIHEFKNTWDDLNAKRGFSWNRNPWVFAITFKRIEGDKDYA